jgi:Uncharacterised protein conserved in bacteria (DUF2336)
MARFSAYSPLDSLVDLACRDGVDIRPTLLRVLTDLYVQKPIHSADEERQYVELALGLIEAVDAPTRAAVATRLSTYPGAPVALRSKLGVTSPAPTPDFSEAAEATAAAEPAAPSCNDVTELFFIANSQERRLILTNLHVAAEEGARRPPLVSRDLVAGLENAALKRNLDEFGRLLEEALDIDHALAERITRDDAGEPIVVAAKALRLSAAVLQRILLFLNPVIGQSVARVFELAHLYDEMKPAAADRMLAIWREATAPVARQTRHAAYYWDDERRNARSLSSPSQRRATRVPGQQSSRFAWRGRA